MISQELVYRPWKALTLWQPWASLVVTGHKRIETRSWGTKFRGLLLIHASQKPAPLADYHPTKPSLIPPLTVEAMIEALGTADFDALPKGAILGLARVANCIQLVNEYTLAMECPACVAWGGQNRHRQQEHQFGNYQAGRWAWILEDVARLETPHAWKGRQGLWTPPETLVNYLRGATLMDARIGAV